MISVRHLAKAAQEAAQHATTDQARSSAEIWLSELIWRDFYQTILFKFPHVRKGSFNPKYDAIKWSNDQQLFAAWCAGKTGFSYICLLYTSPSPRDS